MAVICGTPAPVTTRVVQMEPGPMPTLMPSAPARASSQAPSKVATLPASSCISGSFDFKSFTASSTFVDSPRALSTATTSPFASASYWARSRKSPVAPMAAPTRRRPGVSVAARFGSRLADAFAVPSALRPLHLVDFSRLLLNAQVAMDDPQAALLSGRNRDVRFGHSIHVGAFDGNIQADVAGELGVGSAGR